MPDAPEPEPQDEGDEQAIVDYKCTDCDEVTDHTVLRAASASWTLRCEECGKVSTVAATKQPRIHPLPVILSEGATSRNAQVVADAADHGG